MLLTHDQISLRSSSTECETSSAPQEDCEQDSGESNYPTTSSNETVRTEIVLSLEDRLKSLTQPNQPKTFDFPPRVFGSKQRKFQASWFDKYPWLHYDSSTDSAFCYHCVKANYTNALSASRTDQAFTTKGFTNWKKAMTKDGFHDHELSHAHREATLRIIKAPVEYVNIGVNLSEQYMMEQLNNRKMLLKILSNVRYLGNYTLFLTSLPYVKDFSVSDKVIQIWYTYRLYS